MRSSLLAILAALTAVLLSSCSAMPYSAGPKLKAVVRATPRSSAELHSLLVTTTTLPSGLDVANNGPIDDRHDYDDLGLGRKKPNCGELLGMPSFIFGATRIQPIGNTTVSFVQESSPHWMATERLLSYPPGGAHLVLRDLKDLVAGCALMQDGGNEYSLSIEPGPALGDESLMRVLLAKPWDNGRQPREADAVAIRSGDNLIIIEGVGVPQGQPTPLDQVAAAAYRAFAGG